VSFASLPEAESIRPSRPDQGHAFGAQAVRDPGAAERVDIVIAAELRWAEEQLGEARRPVR
jgi:hypothetical protein